MNRIKYYITPVCFTVLLLSYHSALSQQAQVDSIRSKFDSHRKLNLQEKLYVHTDQDTYLIGETLWFRIYYLDGALHRPLDLSKVAYVEILDKNNVPVLQTKVDLPAGGGEGSVFLPATINSGHFTLRAYTQWMKNFDPQFYFHKTITIINPFLKPDFDKPRSGDAYELSFFPEGGYLVQGLRTKIGFKISDKTGRGVKAEGAILSAQNDTLARFTPGKLGIGSFSFTPAKGEKYRAVIRNEAGSVSEHPLPEIMESGYSMRVTDTIDQQIKVVVSGTFADPQDQSFVSLFVHARQIIAKAQMKYFQNGKCVFLIDRPSMAEGISHLTIFNDVNEPVCERLYFNTPQAKLNITVRPDRAEYAPRRKVTLHLQSTGSGENNGTPANLSVAVSKADSITGIVNPDIFDYLWLSSELGPVETPEYYSNSSNEDVRIAIDNLMLTHGWRRFKWRDVLDKSPGHKFIPELRGHLLRAAIKDYDSTARRPLTYLSIPGKVVRLYGSRADKNGEIVFEMSEVYGQQKIMILSPDLGGDPERLLVQSPFSNAFTTTPKPEFILSSASANNLLSRAVAMQAQDIYYEDIVTQFLQPAVDSSAFYGTGDEIYLLDSYTRFPVMEEVMREYVPGVFVRKRKDGFHFVVIDGINGGVLSGDPMILLDGLPLFDADRIMTVDPLKIKKLEVIKSNYYLGPLLLPGIVSFTTYNGDIADIELDPGTLKLNYEGLQLKREFFSPRYENQKQLDNRMPDRRYLLYWNPKVTTATDGTYKVEFYTSDITGNFKIEVQGVNSKGDAGSTVEHFTVK